MTKLRSIYTYPAVDVLAWEPFGVHFDVAIRIAESGGTGNSRRSCIGLLTYLRKARKSEQENHLPNRKAPETVGLLVDGPFTS